jgi:hypothetical protein
MVRAISRDDTRPSRVIGIAIYWNWFDIFISILSEPRWSSSLENGNGVVTANTWGKEKRGLIDSGLVMEQLRTAAGYEVFVCCD